MALAVLLLRVPAAHAHTVGVSQSDVALDGANAHARLVFARREAQALLGDGSPEEVLAFVERGLELRADDAPCTAHDAHAERVEADGIAVEANLTCPQAPVAEATVTFYFLSDLPGSHRHFARIRAGSASTQQALDGERRRLLLPLAGQPSSVATPRFIGALRMGVSHILFGWDHLLFLLALVVAERRPRSLLVLVTTFTVAHSITLALAALNVVTPPPLVVEAGIAASIAYVALENLGRRTLPRPALTFAFGLLHGFGFAAALRGLSLTKARALPILAGFNLGVEAGQGVVVLALFGGFLMASRRGWLSPRVLRGVSITIAVVGLCLMSVRLIAAVRGTF